MRINHIVILLGLLLIMAGCATTTQKQATSLSGVRKGPPVVYVHPLSLAPYKNASIGIPAFIVPDNMGALKAEQVAGLFRDVFLGKRTFLQVKQINGAYGDFPQAIEAGRRAGTDLVLAGVVNYALEGTEFGGARVEVAIRLLNVATGNTVWSIGQSMDQPVAYPDMGFFQRAFASLSLPPIKPSNSGQVLENMLAQIAVDMADVIGGARYVKR
jgi:hypothetical protein